MNTFASVDIVVVSFNVRNELKDCLSSLADLPSNFTIYVVDNASNDGTLEMIHAEFPFVRIIESGGNIGFSPANNLAMERGTGEYILLLNPDTIVKSNSIEKWLELHIVNDAGLSACRLLNVDGSLQNSAWKTPGILDSLLELFYIHIFLTVTQYPLDYFSRDFNPENVSGAAMLFKRSIFKEIGGLDPNLFWMEDTDYCYRIRELGYKICYFNEPEIIHIGGQSSKSNYNRVISNQLISRLKFIRKQKDVFSFFVLAIIIYIHVVSRMFIFGFVSIFKKQYKSTAYFYSFERLNRYIWKNDLSI